MLRVFISYATEDKNSLAKPLADLLVKNGVSVWYDEYELKLGDSLRKSIDKGLIQSDFGIVILSPSFLNKNWPEYELNSLITLEQTYSRKIILPVWHNIDAKDLISYSPSLADKIAVNTKSGFEFVSKKILIALNIKQQNIYNQYDINSDSNIKLNWGIFNSDMLFNNIQLLNQDNRPSGKYAPRIWKTPESIYSIYQTKGLFTLNTKFSR